MEFYWEKMFPFFLLMYLENNDFISFHSFGSIIEFQLSIILVTPEGVEPSITWMKAKCPRPLDDGAYLKTFYSTKNYSHFPSIQFLSYTQN